LSVGTVRGRSCHTLDSMKIRHVTRSFSTLAILNIYCTKPYWQTAHAPAVFEKKAVRSAVQLEYHIKTRLAPDRQCTTRQLNHTSSTYVCPSLNRFKPAYVQYIAYAFLLCLEPCTYMYATQYTRTRYMLQLRLHVRTGIV